MKTLITFLLSLFFFVPSVSYAERITDFHSDIYLQKDDSVKVIETVRYDTEGESHHGIYRNVPLNSFEGNPVGLSNVKVVSVKDESGNKYHYETTNTRVSGEEMRQIKIGSGDITFQGAKTYVITYKLAHALSKKSEDGKSTELYFNITGNGWGLPISHVSYTVYANESGGAAMGEGKCFEGMFGSNSVCSMSVVMGGVSASGEGTHSLSPGDGVTIKLPITYQESPFPGAFVMFIEIYGPYIAVALLFVLLFGSIFYLFQKYGKDPKTINPVIPEYDAPAHLTPLQASFILKERLTPESIIAELLYQGREGVLTIEEVKKKNFLWTDTDYRVDMKGTPLIDSSQQLLSAFLVNSGRNLFLKKEASKDSFYISKAVVSYEERNGVTNCLYREMMDGGFYDFILTQKLFRNFLPQTKDGNYLASRNIDSDVQAFVLKVIFGMSFFIFFFSGFITLLGERVVGYLFLFFFCSIISIAVLFKILNRRTEFGVNTKKQLEGLRMYIDAAEDDLINFENAPAKTPTVYMKLLPWAVFFGLEKKWSKKFDGLTITQEDSSYFRSSSFTHGVSTGAFINGISNLQTVSAGAAQSASSSGSGGGSSFGGGSSGGGGGGGGGGSW